MGEKYFKYDKIRLFNVQYSAASHSILCYNILTFIKCNSENNKIYKNCLVDKDEYHRLNIKISLSIMSIHTLYVVRTCIFIVYIFYLGVTYGSLWLHTFLHFAP